MLRSIDVLHDFYVPEFRAKMDMVPGRDHLLLAYPHQNPARSIFCASNCAASGHHTMRSKVVVEEESAYQTWLGEQETFAQSLARAGEGSSDVGKLASSEGQANPSTAGVAQ